ncbi:hypothetical protein TRFO_02044 [Tritrichomonas foetus]|uniref:Uncharacterized protein n=1 Tax=Tritrichomonas foetus TaxID=1144522 RepID=A0A1J4JH48_9EUKA|nr:hypothetical protein TRFO_02044 [Tritrichomonas foetus]|eukprot:OHS96923.1 hypothetical protein TRFO_02044 [Tritrichomonas foetus]
MENEVLNFADIRLKRVKSPKELKPKTNPSDVVERLTKTDKTRNQKLKILKEEIESAESQKVLVFKSSHRSAIAKSKPKEAQIWDNDGKLIADLQETHIDNVTHENSSQSSNDRYKPLERIEPKNHYPDFLERNANIEPMKNKAPFDVEKPTKKKVITIAEHQKFEERQQKSNEKRQTTPKAQKFHSLMSPGSRKMLKNIKERPKPRKTEEFEDINCTFHPDLSLSKRRKVQGLNVEQAEAREVIKSIEKQTLEIDIEQKKMNDCTFHPHLTSDVKMRNNAKKLIEKRRKEAEEEKENTENNQNSEKANEPNNQKGMNDSNHKTQSDCERKQRKDLKAPKRTREILGLLKMFK